MVCEHCGNILEEGAAVCSQCGAQINRPRRGEGAAARRQGRPEKAAGGRMGSMTPSESDLRDAPAANRSPSRSEGRAAAPQRSAPKTAKAARAMDRQHHTRKRPVRRVMINWALLWTVVIVLTIFAIGGAYVFLKMTDEGQLILARMGREASATALWTYGQELMDQGYLEKCVSVLEKAYEMEPERDDIYDRLLQLADAYETVGRISDAERIYTKLYTDIAPEDPAVYRHLAQLLENQNRVMELANFLKLAYEKTGDITFRRQREELLPSTPTASKEAGSSKSEQDVELISAQGYEIIFMLDKENGVFPDDGIPYTGPIHLYEGSHTIRAIAVTSELQSDELRIQYNISLPRPAAPYASLAPGVYERRQRIWLKYNPTEDVTLLEGKRERTAQEEAHLAKLKDLTIYYTLDSQTPTANSPIYTGESFLLPPGKSTVKAIAVNGYGKASNVMERTYEVKLPFKLYFSESDNFSDFTIMETGRDAFVKKFGSPSAETAVEDDSVPGAAVLLTYSWGEARFYMTERGYILYAIETASATATGPRKTKIGMTETEITEKFRDMQQLHNQDGSRSIYYDTQNKKYAMMAHLDAFNDRIDYIYYRSDNGRVTLSYYLENSRVTKMGIRCSFD
ncbi:MAG: chitobiase/beta-hexosaminidase C-terminal domain-containing protein [Clostridia bacterium]|nr:chitobiase/beta-hexosaminidase C-terminal domain-containing protein [Clostridia bacterium]